MPKADSAAQTTSRVLIGTGPRRRETSPVANTNTDRTGRPMASREPTPNRRKECSVYCPSKRQNLQRYSAGGMTRRTGHVPGHRVISLVRRVVT